MKTAVQLSRGETIEIERDERGAKSTLRTGRGRHVATYHHGLGRARTGLSDAEIVREVEEQYYDDLRPRGPLPASWAR